MNLINNRWIPVIREDGAKELIAPYMIAETVNPVMDIAAPRPDFQGALYQFLIGLLQTCFVSEDSDEWLEYWQTPPSAEQLECAFQPLLGAFDLIAENSKPAFLQDLDMPDGERKDIAALLIDAPGGKTLKDNLDHFVKGGTVSCMCEACAATALFTLQTNAPSGGVGHRVGLRGGGPLTTLLVPNRPSSLWQKLWLNVLPQEELDSNVDKLDARVFPWLASTRTSDKKGISTLPDDVSPLQMYWGMPRRIRLEESTEPGQCSLCGGDSFNLIRHFRTKNYGVNYDGPWVHPLTPYRFDPKKVELPLSLKGQPGGLGYRHWLGLNWMDESNGNQSARTVTHFNQQYSFQLTNEQIGLWCFGYDMDNMKARCWYESQLPVLSISSEYQKLFIEFASGLINAAREVVKELRGQIKAAWFHRPKDAKGDTSMIDSAFWQATESGFYQQLHLLAKQPSTIRTMPQVVAKDWSSLLRQQALEQFDYWVLEGEAEDLDMKRITKARRLLLGNINKMKSIKYLEQIANASSEVA